MQYTILFNITTIFFVLLSLRICHLNIDLYLGTSHGKGSRIRLHDDVHRREIFKMPSQRSQSEDSESHVPVMSGYCMGTQKNIEEVRNCPFGLA